MDDVRIPLPVAPTKFLDQFCAFIRLDGKSYATENVYLYWVKQYILFHKKQHPAKMHAEQVQEFLSHLSLHMNAAPNTQKTALNALIFLYNRFLKMPIENLEFSYAKKATRIPAVFSHQEAMDVIGYLGEPYKLMAQLMYGAGLRVSEVLRLRVKDIDFNMGYIIILDGKGFKDRTTLLPKKLIDSLKNQIKYVEKLLALDKQQGVAGVYMPNRLEKKYLNAGKSLAWQYIFPSTTLSKDPRSNQVRRHHIYATSIQSHVKRAILKTGIPKKASCHTFRHSFATRLLQSKYDLKQIQTLMGHSDIRTTEIYLHVLDELGDKVKSPLDEL